MEGTAVTQFVNMHRTEKPLPTLAAAAAVAVQQQ
tara:strand:+ start:377 stop:478 length:102 start_codon:yes stop_codon:yes gene_type:complete